MNRLFACFSGRTGRCRTFWSSSSASSIVWPSPGVRCYRSHSSNGGNFIAIDCVKPFILECRSHVKKSSKAWEKWSHRHATRADFPNWDRQKVPKLQLFLLFPLHWGTGGFHAKKSLSVCPFVRLSSTIWVCKTRKWFKHFVRGTVETENSLNTHISRLCA